MDGAGSCPERLARVEEAIEQARLLDGNAQFLDLLTPSGDLA